MRGKKKIQHFVKKVNPDDTNMTALTSAVSQEEDLKHGKPLCCDCLVTNS